MSLSAAPAVLENNNALAWVATEGFANTHAAPLAPTNAKESTFPLQNDAWDATAAQGSPNAPAGPANAPSTKSSAPRRPIPRRAADFRLETSCPQGTPRKRPRSAASSGATPGDATAPFAPEGPDPDTLLRKLVEQHVAGEQVPVVMALGLAEVYRHKSTVLEGEVSVLRLVNEKMQVEQQEARKQYEALEEKYNIMVFQMLCMRRCQHEQELKSRAQDTFQDWKATPPATPAKFRPYGPRKSTKLNDESSRPFRHDAP